MVKVLDLRSNGQVSSWVRTPVVAFFLKTAVGMGFVTESKQITVSKWLRQWNVSKNYEFHQITILLASKKNWKATRVNSEIPIKKASYHGLVVKALDLRSNGQVSSWVRTPVIAFFLKTAVGSEFFTESKQMTVSKWLRQEIDSMNYDFHQITILLASMKNWNPPRVVSEIFIEKTSLSSWLRTPVLAFLSESRLANENCHQMKPKSNLNRWPRPSCTYCKAVRGGFLKKHIIWTISVTAGKFASKKISYYGRMVRALDLRSNGLVSSWVRTLVVAFFLKTAVGIEFVTESNQMTVSKWLGQWNVSMNYEFHQITILLASMKNWKAPRVNSEIPI